MATRKTKPTTTSGSPVVPGTWTSPNDLAEMSDKLLQAGLPKVPEGNFQETRQIYGVTNLEGKVLGFSSRWDAEEHLTRAQQQYRFLGGLDDGPFKIVTRTEIVRQFVDDWHEV